MVYVLDRKKQPLASCSAARARKLLKEKKAVIHKKDPFTIRLKIDRFDYKGGIGTCSLEPSVSREQDSVNMNRHVIKSNDLNEIVNQLHKQFPNDQYEQYEVEVKAIKKQPKTKSQISVFWSLQDQVGKTSTLVNTALLLAENKETKIAVLDFDLFNPSLHLHISSIDPNRNVAAFMEDEQNRTSTNELNIHDYLFSNSTHENLYFLTGFILKMKKPNPEDTLAYLKKILHLVKESGFTHILIDTPSHFHGNWNPWLLNEANQVFVHVTETPGSLNVIRRFFDREIGEYYQHFTTEEKLTFIITKSLTENETLFSQALQHIFESKPLKPLVHIPENTKLTQSIYLGKPLLYQDKTFSPLIEQKPLYFQYQTIANHILTFGFVEQTKPLSIVVDVKDLEWEAFIETTLHNHTVHTVSYPHQLENEINKETTDLIILRYNETEPNKTRKTIFHLRTRFPDTRVVCLLPSHLLNYEISFLFQWMIFDILEEPCTAEELKQVVEKPKTFQDIAYEAGAYEVGTYQEINEQPSLPFDSTVEEIDEDDNEDENE